jgi:dolichyl-phosphate-mannose--protein O-mannosyl transferase
MRWAHTVLAGMQVLTAGTALSDVIGVKWFAFIVLVVGAAQVSLATYQAGQDAGPPAPPADKVLV